jgi:alpha-ketoglutarate-dependent taurine dioxygenase
VTTDVRVTPLAATLGAQIDGVELRRLDDETWAVLERAFHDHAVLIFHDQHLSRAEQIAFGRRFGELEIDEGKGYRPSLAGKPVVLDISNVDDDGTHITDRQHPLARRLTGNEGWHTDSSFKAVAAKASVLAAVEVTSSGGETGFADMRAAYDALSADQQLRLAGLRGWHSSQYSNAVAGASDLEPASDPTTMLGAWHPLVSRHPATGRRSLFIGRHACSIDGMEVAAGQAWLAELLLNACRPPRVFTHRWATGDVIVWDNRCVLHHASPWDLRERRVMRHVRIGGDRTDRFLNPGA